MHHEISKYEKQENVQNFAYDYSLLCFIEILMYYLIITCY